MSKKPESIVVGISEAAQICGLSTHEIRRLARVALSDKPSHDPIPVFRASGKRGALLFDNRRLETWVRIRDEALREYRTNRKSRATKRLTSIERLEKSVARLEELLTIERPTADCDPLINLFFIGGDRQGQVKSKFSSESYIVGYHSWIDGREMSWSVVSAANMQGWKFFREHSEFVRAKQQTLLSGSEVGL
jgi:hypothetical protein